MAIIDVRCPQCRKSISAVDINMSAMAAKCNDCDVVFTIETPTAQTGMALAVSDMAPSRPRGISEEEGPMGERIIRIRWFYIALVGLLFFCIAWDGFLVFWYSMVVFGMGKQGQIEWIAVLFPIAHVAVGVGLTYHVLTGFLNSTWITIDSESVRVRHAPLPWRGNRHLAKDEIRAIELNLGTLQPQNGGQTMTVCAHHVDGRQILLLTGLEMQKAEYVAWQLAHILRVPLNRRNPSTMQLPQMPAFLQRFFPQKQE